MAITQTACNSYKLELPQAIHNFTAGTGDTFKMALYNSLATLNQSTTVYSTTNELVGTGYTAGGVVLTAVTPTLYNNTAVWTFANAVWAGATFTNVAGALIYNSSKANRAICALSFGQSFSCVSQTFTVVMPATTDSSAVLRIA